MIGQTPTSLPTYLQPHLLLINYEFDMALIRFRDNQKDKLDDLVAKIFDLCGNYCS